MREPFRHTRKYITALLVLEICMGIGILVATAFYHRALQIYLADMERKMLGGQFFNAYLLGCQLIVTYLCGLVLWQNLWCERYTKHIGMALNIWLIFCSVVVICGLGTIWSLFICANAMENSAESSMRRGIDLYYSDPEWKLLWDGIQYHKQCCGVRDYNDWRLASWMPPQNVIFETGCANEEEGCDDECEPPTPVILAPYACCKLTCPSCFENYIPRGGNCGIPFLNITQINTNGCLPMFSSSMWTILYVLLIMIAMSLKFDLAIFILTKLTIRCQENEKITITDGGLTDDDGRPLVVVRCPPNVRCLALHDDDCFSDVDGLVGDQAIPCQDDQYEQKHLRSQHHPDYSSRESSQMFMR